MRRILIGFLLLVLAVSVSDPFDIMPPVTATSSTAGN